jgi:hypothetical protein
MSIYHRASNTVLDAGENLGYALKLEDLPVLPEETWVEMEAYAQRHQRRRRVGTLIWMAFGGEWPYTAAGFCVELSYCLRKEVEGWSRWLVLQPEHYRNMVPIAKGAPPHLFES